MAEPRTLIITIEVEDDGGPDDYDTIMYALSDIGAQVINEKEKK